MEQQSTLFGSERHGGGDIFADSKIPASDAEKRVAGVLWGYKGRSNPIALRTLAAVCNIGERELKGVIERLRNDHGLRIGASRRDPAGYFVVVDREDALLALASFKSQIFTMLKTYRRLATPGLFQELSGQIRMELADEKGEPECRSR